jgi:prephenate dehydrogenase
MTVQLTIIGLGQIGASVGLALASYPNLVKRIGHDRSLEIARKAEKMGALDRVEINLHNAVRDADIVLLSLPMDQIRETLTQIAPDLNEGAVVMDTGPVKEVVAAWAGELLPPERFYIGLTPVINPAYLYNPERGLEAAHNDLFRGSIMAIVSPPRTSSEAIKLAADFTRLLGANPLFADPLEMDGLMAATHILPQLVGAALLNATVDQPGWREGRKVAGRAYAEATAPLVQLGEPKTLTAATLLNRENVLRALDSMIAAMQAIRDDVMEEKSESLEERLRRSRQGGETWWKQRRAGDWLTGEAYPAVDIPTASETFGHLLGLVRKPKNKS